MTNTHHSVPKWIVHQVNRLGIGQNKKQDEDAPPPPIPTEHHEVVIVGGGVAGLYTAYRLLQHSEDAGVADIVVLEGRGGVGGRITTQRDMKTGDPLFNNFGWRVGEVNKEMIALAKELDIKLVPQVTPAVDKKAEEEGQKGNNQCKHGTAGHVCSVTNAERDKYVVPDGRAPLSDFATACMISASQADKQDRESGYAGRTAQISWPDESHGVHAFVVEGGMDEYPQKLAAKLPEEMVRVNHRVTDVVKNNNDDNNTEERGNYTVYVMKRNGNMYTPCCMTCDTVVLAAPPVSLRRFSVAQQMLPALFAVHQRRLGHVYVRCCGRGRENDDVTTYPDVPDRSDVPDRIYRKMPDSILQQLISGDYGRGIFQAAYACDRFERVWRELQFHGPQSVMEQVKRQLGRIQDMKVPPAGWDDTIEEVFVRISFVHRWHIEAHVSGKHKEELSLQAVAPNPARLPCLYLAGEAFSPHQGWTEGALWTGGRVAEMIARAKKAGEGEGACGTCCCSISPNSEFIELKKTHPNDPASAKLEAAAAAAAAAVDATGGVKKKNFMVYRGIVVDTSDWHDRHPGGVGMIKGHADEDVSELFDNFHGGWPAPLATLFGLQIGCTDYTTA